MKQRIDLVKAAGAEVFGALAVGADRKHRNVGVAGRTFTPAQTRALSVLVRSAMVVRARPKCAQSSETDCFSSLASCCNPVIILPRILRIALISPHRRVISSVSMLSAPCISFRYSWIPPAGETPEGGPPTGDGNLAASLL